jgi:hypothetical protein
MNIVPRNHGSDGRAPGKIEENRAGYNYPRNLLVLIAVTTMASLWVTKLFFSARMRNLPAS